MDFIEDKEIPIKEENPLISSKETSITNKIRSNPWILATIVLGILSVLLILGNSTLTNSTVISEDEVGEMLVSFYEAQGIEGLQVVLVEDINDFYKVDLSYQGQVIPFYVTKTGYLTGNSIVSLVSGNYNIIDEDLGESDVISDSIEVGIDDDAIKGDLSAPITIVEFSDYECPFCGKHFRETLPKIITEYVDTGKVKIVFRDFPLGFHSYAQKAAEAAECAGEFGDDKYWEMHDKLFNNQDALDVNSLKKYAEELGLDISNCLDSGEMADEVKADMEDGDNYGVSGTPASFVNGILVSGAQPFSEFKKIIDEELAKV